MLPRILEPEVMDTALEATDYDAMDHAAVNRSFVADLLAWAPFGETILDLGTGTALIPIELAQCCDSAKIVAVDAARHMLGVSTENVHRAGLTDRITLECVDAKQLPYDDASFATIMSNSIIHHVAEPFQVLAEVWRVLTPGGLAFFRDLARPDDEQTVQRLVDTYAAGENDHQRQMFGDSLRAALTIDEMAELVTRLGAGPNSVIMTSDRHWTWAFRKPD